MYKDKEKNRQKQREWVRQKRLNTKGSTVPGCQLDVNSTKHKIDYEDRRKHFMLLLSWAEGQGDGYQYRLGNTALQYTKSRSVDVASYLGHTEQQSYNPMMVGYVPPVG